MHASSTCNDLYRLRLNKDITCYNLQGHIRTLRDTVLNTSYSLLHCTDKERQQGKFETESTAKEIPSCQPQKNNMVKEIDKNCGYFNQFLWSICSASIMYYLQYNRQYYTSNIRMALKHNSFTFIICDILQWNIFMCYAVLNPIISKPI